MALQIEIGNSWVRNRRIDNKAWWAVVVVMFAGTESVGYSFLHERGKLTQVGKKQHGG